MNKINNQIIDIYIFLLVGIIFYMINNTITKIIGAISIILLFFLQIFILLRNKDKLHFNKLWGILLCILGITFVALIKTPTVSALYTWILQSMLLLIAPIVSNIKLSKYDIKKICNFFNIIFYTLLFLSISNIILMKSGNKFLTHELSVLFMMATVVKSCRLNKSKMIGLYTLVVTIFFIEQERNLALTILVVLFAYFIIKLTRKRPILLNSIFMVFSLFVLYLPYFYVKLSESITGSILNSYVREYTGKNLFSGRHIIWQVAFNYIEKSPFWGFGIDNNIFASNNIYMSTHNVYVYILLQGGLLFAILFLIYLFLLWSINLTSTNNKTSNIFAAFIMGIMIYSNFGMVLLGNMVSVSIYIWFLIGIGVHFSKNTGGISS